MCAIALLLWACTGYSEIVYVQGFKCAQNIEQEWSSVDKQLLMDQLGETNVKYYFLESEEVKHIETKEIETCSYRTKSLRVNIIEYKALDTSVRGVNMFLPYSIGKGDILKKYKFYAVVKDIHSGYYLHKYFDIQLSPFAGVSPQPKINHVGFLAHGVSYIATAIVEHESGILHVYSMKVSPK